MSQFCSKHCIIFLLTAIWLSCSPDTGPAAGVPAKSPYEKITGKWHIEMIRSDTLAHLPKNVIFSYDSLMHAMLDSSYIDFDEDSVFTGWVGPDLIGGKWQVSGDYCHIVTYDLHGNIETYRIRKADKDSLWLRNLTSGHEMILSRWR